MAAVVRKFTIPPSLQDEQTARLKEAIDALPEQQRRLTERASTVVAASSTEFRSDAVEIKYEIKDARSIAQVISSGAIETEQLLEWAVQLCAAFAAAYPLGESALLRHGGLCPDAVWVTSDQQLRVLDFGVAESFAAASQSLDESWLMQVAGNVAPEVWNTPSRFGQQSDIFAVGVLLYELATGKHPFGAIRDDPEDCKYQILVEVPVPPKTRRPSLADGISDVIYKAVRSEPEKRFSTFREMCEALEACKKQITDDDQAASQPAAAPIPEVPKPTPQEAAAPTAPTSESVIPVAEHAAPAPTEDQEQRKQYLEDQAKLRVEREQAEGRQRERRERTRRTMTKIRRHAVALTVAILALALVSAGLYVVTQRSRNQEALDGQLAALNTELGKQFTIGSAASSDAMARLLGIEESSPRLVRALDDLRKVAPDIAPTIESAAFSNLLCSYGQAALVLGEVEVVLEFELESDDESTLLFTTDDLSLARSISTLVDTLANAQLDESVRGLTSQLRALFSRAQSVTQAGAKLADLSSADRSTPPLGYLAYQGEFKMIDVGRFDPVLGETAVVSEVVLMDKSGQEIANVNASLVFAYDCGTEGSACQLLSVTVEPAKEPAAHIQWCIENTQVRIRQAFADRDAEALASLTNPAQLAEIRRTLEWATLCKTAELVFDELTLNTHTWGAAVAGASIHYVPGILPGSDSSFDSPLMVFTFEAATQQRVGPSVSCSWPAAPPELHRQQLGLVVLNRMTQAWRERDAEAYIALFEGTTRDAQSAADMFTRIEQSGAQFQITAREDPDTKVVLYVEISSNTEGYSLKAFEFVLRDENLVWNARSEHAGASGDPLWVIAGEAYQTLAARLTNATANEIDGIESDFTAGLRQDMSNDERERIQRWLAALRSAGQLFEPASSEFLCGFPLRAKLRKAAANQMMFHLLTMPGAPANVVYVQEREVQVADIQTLWSRRRGDQPWRLWSEITGAPPRDQVVGLNLAEAAELAKELDCEIPTLAEWRAAVEQIPDAKSMDFVGGVWELCSGSAEQSATTIVGGCWHDHDTEVQAAGIKTNESATGPARFGTIGFRMCKRFSIPNEALVAAPNIPRKSAP